MSKRNKATVICIDKNRNNVLKPFQVPLYFLKNWKIIFASTIFLFVGLITTIFLLTSNNENVELKVVKQPVQSEIITVPLENQKPSFDTIMLKDKFEAIDQKLSKINTYLKKKGVRPLFTNFDKNVKEGITWASLNGLMDNYNTKLEKTSEMLANMPFGMPMSNTQITSYFGSRSNPFSGKGAERHKGLDFKGDRGDLVKTTAAGNVVFAGKQSGYGNVVIVKHSNGYETKYAHLSKILVKKGSSIKVGEDIGKVGSTGRSTGPHLHYEVLKNGKQINPKSFLNYE